MLIGHTSSETWNWRFNCSALGHPALGPVNQHTLAGACWPARSGQWSLAAVRAGQHTLASDRFTGPSAVWLQSVLACWAMPGTTDARDQCMLAYFTTRQLLLGVQQHNTDVCGQKFAVLWLKITFHLTLSQLKSINLHKPWPITVHKSTNTVCYYTWQAHALESIHT